MPEGARLSTVHDLRGDPSRWRRDIPGYERLRLEDVYPGIDMVLYSRDDTLEYDFVLAPGASPRQIRLSIGGASPEIDANGGLVAGPFRQPAPVIHQYDGARIAAAYRIAASGDIVFDIGPYDARRPLVIDPLLVYSSGFGGSGRQESVSSPRCYWDTPMAIAVDADGNAYVTGDTPSLDYPVLDGIDRPVVELSGTCSSPSSIPRAHRSTPPTSAAPPTTGPRTSPSAPTAASSCPATPAAISPGSIPS